MKTDGQILFEDHFSDSICVEWDSCSDAQKAVWEEAAKIVAPLVQRIQQLESIGNPQWSDNPRNIRENISITKLIVTYGFNPYVWTYGTPPIQLRNKKIEIDRNNIVTVEPDPYRGWSRCWWRLARTHYEFGADASSSDFL